MLALHIPPCWKVPNLFRYLSTFITVGVLAVVKVNVGILNGVAADIRVTDDVLVNPWFDTEITGSQDAKTNNVNSRQVRNIKITPLFMCICLYS